MYNIIYLQSNFYSLILGLSRVLSHDVMVDIMVSQNNAKAAMLVSQTIPVGVEPLCYVNKTFDGNMGENTLQCKTIVFG